MGRPTFSPGKEWAGPFFPRAKKLTGGNSSLLHRYNKISFCGVIENILTLGVRVPGSNPGGSKKVGSWKLIWMLQLY